MRVLIVEDEAIAARHLESLLREIDPEIQVAAKLDSVKNTSNWLKINSVDLIFLDIQLSDGLSFDIFDRVQVKTPIIFTTAYDHYAIKAFKLNSIDYLLKPIQAEELAASIAKWKELSSSVSIQNLPELLNSLRPDPEYKKRFLIHSGRKLKTIETTEIAYFYAMEKDTYMATLDGKTYPADYSLDKLEPQVNPERFFRINRSYLVNIDAIKQMYTTGKNRIKVDLIPPVEDLVFVSISRSSAFKHWLNG